MSKDLKDLKIVPDFGRISIFINNLNNFQNLKLINGIVNKLQGHAQEAVLIRGAKNWYDKNTLIQIFGDHRPENSLTQDLVNLKQKT